MAGVGCGSTQQLWLLSPEDPLGRVRTTGQEWNAFDKVRQGNQEFKVGMEREVYHRLMKRETSRGRRGMHGGQRARAGSHPSPVVQVGV